MTATSLDHIKQITFQAKPQVAAGLPSHMRTGNDANALLASAFASIQKNDQLKEAVVQSPHTLMAALNDAALKGLLPGTDDYYLTPRKNKGRWEVLGVTGYRGLIALMHRAGFVTAVHATVIRERDEFQFVRGVDAVPRIEVNWRLPESQRGPIVLAVAWADMIGGGHSEVVIVDTDRVARAKEASPSSRSQYGPWARDEAAMWRKTALRDLAKFVPTSAEFRPGLAAPITTADPAPTIEAAPPAEHTDQDALTEHEHQMIDAETGEVIQ